MLYFLYVKTSPTGLKYLGKTIKDPFIYIGSGKIWKRHLKKHKFTKDDIKTEILLETGNIKELVELGAKYSKKWNIVKSDEWANLRPEMGDGGDTSKFINYNKPGFRGPWCAYHLNNFDSDEEKQKAIEYRTSKINYKDPERMRKIIENTDYKSLCEKRNTDYSKFLDNIHEGNKKPILQLDLEGNIIKEWRSVTDAGNELGIKRGTIQSWIYNDRIGIGCRWIKK